MEKPAKGIYYMILGRDLLTELGLNSKSSKHITESYYGYFEGYSAPMVDMTTYIY